ncbi:ribosome small subunit-dependent GTPase A [Balneolaceae bacterium ANBcel3]|nr:ribosome small subunit-dependent GTPase A [Balneolaceae bacterium ANBcel3]
MKGRVIKATGSWYTIQCDDGRLISARLPGKFRLTEKEVTNPVAVGDRVQLKSEKDDTAVITDIEERKNRLVRKATHGKKGIQILASNLDQVLILQSVKKPEFKSGFIDRVLVMAEAQSIKPVIVFNKTDLIEKTSDQEKLNRYIGYYKNIGYQVLLTSILDSDSLDSFKELVHGKLSAMTGPSGTGKTSLVNSLDPELKLKTGEISGFSNKGKHTTTFAQLLSLGDETYIVDTPGIREFGLIDIEPYEISHYFPEMMTVVHDCRYNTCTHRHEPSCAIKEAVERGTVSEDRYRSYLNILDSIEIEGNKG